MLTLVTSPFEEMKQTPKKTQKQTTECECLQWNTIKNTKYFSEPIHLGFNLIIVVQAKGHLVDDKIIGIYHMFNFTKEL